MRLKEHGDTLRHVRLFCFLSLTLSGPTACGSGSSQADTTNSISQPPASPPTPPPANNVDTASVHMNASFNVNVTTDVKYGEGLRHASWNSEEAIPIDLLLDIYMPANEETRRPVAVFIHGGGFRGGNKSFSRANDFMRYFAERGFVGFSINYRLLGDYGTIPDILNDTVDLMTNLPSESRDQIKAIYPATRDAKAAIRWLYANQDELGLDTNHITVIGGSAGSLIGVALGVTEASDFTNEIGQNRDSSLTTVNTNMPARVHTVVDHWGSGEAVELINTTFNVNRWDATDTPLSIVHGTEDQTVLFEEALILQDTYQRTGVAHAFYPLQGAGHGAWSADAEGQALQQLALDFVLQTQTLSVLQ